MQKFVTKKNIQYHYIVTILLYNGNSKQLNKKLIGFRMLLLIGNSGCEKIVRNGNWNL